MSNGTKVYLIELARDRFRDQYWAPGPNPHLAHRTTTEPFAHRFETFDAAQRQLDYELGIARDAEQFAAARVKETTIEHSLVRCPYGDHSDNCTCDGFGGDR